MNSRIPMYVLTLCLLTLSLALKSPAIACITVALWAFDYAHSVMTSRGRDAEIVGLILRMEKIEKANKELAMDVTNVAERAKTILGEVY